MPTIRIAPFNRIEGHLDIEATVNLAGTVTDTECEGVMFRGWENILLGRDPRDMPILGQRV
jgi:hydrogenase large subunit